MAEFKFGGGASGPFIKERCCLSLEVLEQSHEFANLQELASYMYSSHRGASNRAKSTTACITLCVACEITLVNVKIWQFQPRPANFLAIQYDAHLKYVHMHYAMARVSMHA